MDKTIGDGGENGESRLENVIETIQTEECVKDTDFEDVTEDELQISEKILENQENRSVPVDSDPVENKTTANNVSHSVDSEHLQGIGHEHFEFVEKSVEPTSKDSITTEQIISTMQPTENTEYNNEYLLEQQSEHVFMEDGSQNQDQLVELEHNYISEVTGQVSHADMKEESESTDHFVETTDNNFISQYEYADNSITINLVDEQQPCNPQEHSVKEDVSVVNESEYVDNSVEISTEEVPSLILCNESDNSILEDTRADPIKDNSLVQVDTSEPAADQSDSMVIKEHSTEPNQEFLENKTDDLQVNDNVTFIDVQISNTDSTVQLSETNSVVEYIPSTEISDKHIQESVEAVPIQDNYSEDKILVCEEISPTTDNTLPSTENTLIELKSVPNIETIVDSAIDEQSKIIELTKDVPNKSETTQSSQEPVAKKPRKTRKSHFEVPMHILGHNITKPLENVPNGRQLPKPRLGVKVPYCNLTSQIVSKADIEREVMERSRLKQEQAQAKGEVLFARSLTKRLARKLAPPTTSKDKDVKSTEAEVLEKNTKNSDENQTTTVPIIETIENDSDLLAILEGEGEEIPVVTKEANQLQQDETNIKLLEREIALQQLQDLPHLAPKQRIFRSRIAKIAASAAESPATLKKKNSPTEKHILKTSAKLPEIDLDKSKSESVIVQSPLGKENSTVSSPKKDIDLVVRKQPIEIEPQVKVNMVLKTYSRKRKTSDLLDSSDSSSSPKKPTYQDPDFKIDTTDISLPTNAYVTKSSRVIKKKVIWDPDEIPVRSPKPALKQAAGNVRTEVFKVAKILDRNSNTEKKPIVEKGLRSIEKKVIEKLTPTLKKIPEKKSVQKISPKINKTPIKPKKNLSEIDKLLMDEGAVKMLYELKNTEDTPGKKKKTVYMVERAQRDIVKKANQIKNELEQITSNDSAISLRKKEGVSTPSPVKPAVNMERKMSKDSVRSLHTPPSSPFPQGSMLIRRRSSSSISSSDDLDSDTAKVNKKKSDGPKTKKFKKTVEEPKENKSTNMEAKKEYQQKVGNSENKMNNFSSFTVKKVNKQVTISLICSADKCFLTVEVLEELTSAINKFGKDKDVNVLTVASSGKVFCSGLQYRSILSSQEAERKVKATKLAEAVRDFLLCLLHFPKVLVAGIQGECVGLGVTMLPLFDIIIASDTATFRTPYAQLGTVGEGGFLLSSPKLTNHGLAAELLYTGQTLTADEAFRRGLISKLCWPEKYKDTLKGILTSISNGSKQSLMATKVQLQSNSVEGMEQALNLETKILIEHWTTTECQRNFEDLETDN